MIMFLHILDRDASSIESLKALCNIMLLYAIVFIPMCFCSFQVTDSNLTSRRQSFHRQAIRKWSDEGIQ